MARHEDRFALVGDRSDQHSHLCNAGGVEAIGGLIEDEEIRVFQQRRCNGKPLFHAERIAVEGVISALGEANNAKDSLDFGLGCVDR